jgi:hypothetical protein
MNPHNDLQLIRVAHPTTNPGGNPEESGSQQSKSQDFA